MCFEINKKTLTKDSIFLIISFIFLIVPICIISILNNGINRSSLLSLLFLGYPIICLILGFVSGILKINLLVELILFSFCFVFHNDIFFNISILAFMPFYIFLNIIAVLLIKNLIS